MTDQSHPPLSIAPRFQGRLDTRAAAVFPVELVMARPQRGSMMARSLDIGMRGICVRTESVIHAFHWMKRTATLLDHAFEVANPR